MKKYLVIGNPIEHSLSPKLHNYWFKKKNINAIYDKKLLNESDIENIISKVKKEEIHGLNVTVPFKKSVIPFLDELTSEANESKSVNTIYKENNKVIGHNTDIAGFELSLRHFKYDVKDKKIFILGAGGVVSSIILALKKMGTSKIFFSGTAVEITPIRSVDKVVIGPGKRGDITKVIQKTYLAAVREEAKEYDHWLSRV